MTRPLTGPDLFADLVDVEALSHAERQRTLRREKVLGTGPVYQGVSKQIRRLTASGKEYAELEPIIDADEHAGVIALCRQLARAVDKATGHNETGWHANGRDLGPLAEQLRQALELLRPETETDEFQEFLQQLDGTVAPARPDAERT